MRMKFSSCLIGKCFNFIAFTLLTGIFIPEAFSQNLIIVRHGEASHNVQRIHSSSLDKSMKYSLTEKGRAQAIHTGEELKDHFGLDDRRIGAVFISPFLRTRQTAELLMKAMNIAPEKAISERLVAEISMGKYDDQPQSTTEFLSRSGDVWDHRRGHEYGGETDEDVSVRVALFLCKARAVPSDLDIIVVTHGSPAKELIALLSRVEPKGVKLPNAGYRILDLKRRRDKQSDAESFSHPTLETPISMLN